MWCEVIVQTFGVEQHFHSVEANAAAIGVLLRATRRAIKRIKDMLELLLGERRAGVFDGEFVLATGDRYHAPSVAVAYRV